MGAQIGEVEFLHAALAHAEHLAGAAQPQILFGDDEAVVGLAQGLQPRFRRVAQRRLINQQAGGFGAAAADAPTQLVQLRQAEAFGMLHHHDGRLRDIHAHFDHRGGDQHLGFAGFEFRHRIVALRPFHPPVHETDRNAKRLP